MKNTRPLLSRLPARRTALKWLHWVMVPLFIWFLLVQPKDVTPFGPAAFQAHSMLALIFVSLSLLWFADLMRRGLASRPGPKLKGRWRTLHRALHLTLIWGLFFVAVTGFLLGLTSAVLLKAGGFLPIAPPMGWRDANDIVGQIHIIEFYALGVVAGGHALFHLWRHYILRDNALRIMLPKVLHRYL
ncbi:cytochrome b [Tateyamaria armeniaca]|uniref:Cytochrome b n=1 Tax=Tateyamaria armeniaca TaxID=2518930 RepID=A0ABW8UY25_9RHOB